MNRTERRIWELISNRKDYKALIQRYRKTLDIPLKGFKNGSQFKKWRDKIDSNVYSDTLKRFRIELYNKFQIFNIDRVSWLATKNLYYTTLSEKVLDYIYGLDFYYLFAKKRRVFPKGLYIKINPLASKSDLRDFIDETANHLRSYQLLFEKDFPTAYKNKIKLPSKNKERDEMVYRLSLMTRNELRLLLPEEDALSAYKDILISNILVHFGFRKQLSPENIRIIIAREKKRVNVTKQSL